MEITKIKSILETADDGDLIKSIRGKLSAIYDIRKGQGGQGEYEFQGATFEDDTGKIKVTFSKCSQPKSAKGKPVTITSSKTSHGWQGIKVVDDSYEKEGETIKTRELRITATAKIEYEGNGGDDEPQRKEASGTSKPSGGSYAVAHPEELIKDVLLAHRRAVSLVNETYDEKSFTPEQMQSFIATIFIEACKRGFADNYIARAAVPSKKPFRLAPKDQSKWREAVVPKGNLEGKTLEEVPDDKLLIMFKNLDNAGSNTPFAECVYQAARDRKLVKDNKPEEIDEWLNPDPDDSIPMD